MQTIYSANNEAGYCEEKTAAFVEKLRGFGWQCSTAQGPAEEPAEEPVEEVIGEQPPAG